MDQMKSHVKDIFSVFGGDKLLDELRAETEIRKKVEIINRELGAVNMSKANLEEYPPDRQRRFLYVVQSLGVDLGLCRNYRIFHSKKNHKLHEICEGTRDKLKAACCGDIRKCTHAFYDSSGTQVKETESEPKKREWSKI